MKSSMVSKKLLSVLVVTSLVLSNVLVSKPLSVKADTNKYSLVVGEVTPEFAQYIKSGIKGKGLIPLPVRFKNFNTNGLPKATDLPAQYDLRTLSRLSPVRDQGQIGSCWTFATYGSLESWMLTSGNGQQDYSENNMMCHHGFAGAPTGGGNMLMSTAYLARWDGPVSEADDPYANPADEQHIVVRDGKIPQKHVQDVVMIPQRANFTDNDDLKNAIMQDGALYTSICYDDKYFNSKTNGFYNYDQPSSTLTANHAVGIVGWDDNYSKNNFSQTPPGDGAFIIRNSWGSSWGDGGYFYVSYYDTFVGTENAAYINAQPTNNYDKIYQYDPFGMVDNLGYNNSTAWFSNVFQAQGNENLSATSFYTTEKSAQYQVYVETNYDTNKFSKLTLVKSGTIDMPGYHTVTLDTPVALNAGKNFAVAVKLVEAAETKPIAIEEYYKGYSDNATASLGQSFMSPDGQNWTDLMQSQPALKANVCLKAFTKAGAPLAGPVVTSTTPTNGSKNIDNTKPITIAFNENVQAGSSFKTIKVADSTNKAVAANCTINANVLTINATLVAGTTYTVTIPQNAVIDTANKTLATAYTFSFTTASISSTLKITSTNPVDKATNVDAYSPLTITFNTDIKAGKNYKNIKVVDDWDNIYTKCTINKNTLTINPSLYEGTTFTVVIPTGAVTDMLGNTLANNYTFSFTQQILIPIWRISQLILITF